MYITVCDGMRCRSASFREHLKEAKKTVVGAESSRRDRARDLSAPPHYQFTTLRCSPSFVPCWDWYRKINYIWRDWKPR